MADMTGMFERSDQEFKTTMTKGSNEKTRNVKEQMCNVSEMKILRKDQKKNARDQKHDRNEKCLKGH